jgi:hypothetical protein
MASRALQMLVLSGVACLLVGQSHAATLWDRPLWLMDDRATTELQQLCLPMYRDALCAISRVIPRDVVGFVKHARERVRNLNPDWTILDVFHSDEELNQFVRDMFPVYVAGCDQMIAQIRGMLDDPQCIDGLLWLFGDGYRIITDQAVGTLYPAEALLTCLLVDFGRP